MRCGLSRCNLKMLRIARTADLWLYCLTLRLPIQRFQIAPVSVTHTWPLVWRRKFLVPVLVLRLASMWLWTAQILTFFFAARSKVLIQLTAFMSLARSTDGAVTVQPRHVLTSVSY